MVKSHRLSKHLRILFVVCGVGLIVVTATIAVFSRPAKPEDFQAWMLCPAAGLLAIVVAVIAELAVGRIETSPSGVACYSSGYTFGTEWANVDRIDVNAFGFANLHFRHRPNHVPILLRILSGSGYDRMIQLSPYIESATTSELLVEIKRYAPQVDIEVLKIEDAKWRWYQRPLSLGSYLLVWLLALVPIAAVTRGLAEAIETSGMPNATLAPSMTIVSAMMGVFAGGMGVVSFAGEYHGARPQDIRLRALGYYFAPIIGLIGGLLLSLLVLSVMRFSGITVPEKVYGSFNFLSMIMGVLSPGLGKGMATLLFGQQRA